MGITRILGLSLAIPFDVGLGSDDSFEIFFHELEGGVVGDEGQHADHGEKDEYVSHAPGSQRRDDVLQLTVLILSTLVVGEALLHMACQNGLSQERLGISGVRHQCFDPLPYVQHERRSRIVRHRFRLPTFFHVHKEMLENAVRPVETPHRICECAYFPSWSSNLQAQAVRKKVVLYIGCN
jgi:hypothetical protein